MPAEQIDAQTRQRQNAKAQKQKLIVALLLCGLLVAIYCQPSKTDDPTLSNNQNAVKTIKPAKLKKSKTKQSDSKVESQLSVVKELTRIDVATASFGDLFFVPKSTSDEMELTETPESATRTVSVKAIYGDHTNTQTALIGNKIVRVGFQLSDGRKVLGVDADKGVRLQPQSPK